MPEAFLKLVPTAIDGLYEVAGRMIARRTFAAILLSLAASVTLPACGALTPDPYPPFRYRMTVEVETPEGLRSGSAVREVDMTDTSNDAGFADIKFKVRGEAIAVELPGGKTLYALLTSDTMEYDYAALIAGRATRRPTVINSPEFKAEFAKMLADRREHVLPRFFPEARPGYRPPGWPLLVTFRDPTEPATIERVDPDDPSPQLGEGVVIRRVKLQITDDTVTKEIEKTLPNPIYKGFYNWDGKSAPGYNKLIGISDFVREYR